MYLHILQGKVSPPLSDLKFGSYPKLSSLSTAVAGQKLGLMQETLMCFYENPD